MVGLVEAETASSQVKEILFGLLALVEADPPFYAALVPLASSWLEAAEEEALEQTTRKVEVEVVA